MDNKKRLGLALCGSYCTYEKLFQAAEKLTETYDLIPIMSENAAETDTRFGTATQHIKRLMLLSGHKVVTTIAEAEPLGPKTPLDALLIAPCTGNTLAKLSHGITDTAVTMAAKAHLRNGRPVIIALSTNDGLSGSAENIAVPDAAVVKQQGSGVKSVYVVSDEGTAVNRVVELGRHFDSKYEILSGLEPGEKVVVKGQNSLRSGDKLKIVD